MEQIEAGLQAQFQQDLVSIDPQEERICRLGDIAQKLVCIASVDDTEEKDGDEIT